jgi:hypothetical protein
MIRSSIHAFVVLFALSVLTVLPARSASAEDCSGSLSRYAWGDCVFRAS